MKKLQIIYHKFEIGKKTMYVIENFEKKHVKTGDPKRIFYLVKSSENILFFYLHFT